MSEKNDIQHADLRPTMVVDGVERISQHTVGARIYRDGIHIGTWIDYEWDGESPRSRLFAAAPDLLAACKSVSKDAEDAELWLYNNIIGSGNYDKSVRDEIDKLCRSMRESIKKAREAIVKIGIDKRYNF